MTIHYHGTPINPTNVMYLTAGASYCVSFSDPQQIKEAHEMGESVMLDNGAYYHWRKNPLRTAPIDWEPYYTWVRPWLRYKTSWAVIPDVIDGTEAQNDRLLCEWWSVFGSFKQAAPVWHLHESIERLERLTRSYDRVCFGSSGEFSTIGSNAWNARMIEVFNHLCKGGDTPCWLHILRGMSLAGSSFPFDSLDSSDVAQNHHRAQNTARDMIRRWNARQRPAAWIPLPEQQRLLPEELVK